MHQEDIYLKHNIKILSDGSPMLFAHGFGCNQEVWKFVYPHFQNDFKVVVFDHAVNELYESIDGYVDDLLKIIENLNLKDLIFVGHSIGATIGLLASIRKPEWFKKLVLITPSACFLNDGEYAGGFDKEELLTILSMLHTDQQTWSHFFSELVIGSNNGFESKLNFAHYLCKIEKHAAEVFGRVSFLSDFRDIIPQAKTETLVLQCDLDATVPVAAGKFVADKIPGSKYVSLNAQGHCPHITHPKQVVKVMNEFLS